MHNILPKCGQINFWRQKNPVDPHIDWMKVDRGFGTEYQSTATGVKLFYFWISATHAAIRSAVLSGWLVSSSAKPQKVPP